jgi:hypothetical protein
MNTQAKLQEVIATAQGLGLHTIVNNNTVTVYLVSAEDFSVTNGRPPAIRANVRNGSRKSIAYNFVGTRTRSITRAEAIDTIISAIN